MNITPRFIRLRDAPAYLGMNINRFNKEVKPHLIKIPIGKRGIAFDRVELDAWADEYKRCNGRPKRGDEEICNENESTQDYTKGRRKTEASGGSTNVSRVLALCAKVQGQRNTKKRSA